MQSFEIRDIIEQKNAKAKQTCETEAHKLIDFIVDSEAKIVTIEKEIASARSKLSALKPIVIDAWAITGKFASPPRPTHSEAEQPPEQDSESF